MSIRADNLTEALRLTFRNTPKREWTVTTLRKSFDTVPPATWLTTPLKRLLDEGFIVVEKQQGGKANVYRLKTVKELKIEAPLVVSQALEALIPMIAGYLNDAYNEGRSGR